MCPIVSKDNVHGIFNFLKLAYEHGAEGGFIIVSRNHVEVYKEKCDSLEALSYMKSQQYDDKFIGEAMAKIGKLNIEYSNRKFHEF